MKTYLLGFLCVAVLASTSVAEIRTWTSKDGTETIEGKFHSRNGTKFTLILGNGNSRVVDSQFLSAEDVAWVEANAGGNKTAAQPEAGGGDPTAAIPAALEGNLINKRARSVSLTERKEGVPKYYLFYYSASWCGPCVAFTPSLVKFHSRKSKALGLEVVLIPSDRSEEDAEDYMKDHRMPWLALKFKAKGKQGIPGNPGRGIPAMRLTDENGESILTTAEVNRNDFFDKAAKLIKEREEG